jgi:hypothetical protein
VDVKALTLFAVNRSLDEAMPIEILAEGFGRLRLCGPSITVRPRLSQNGTGLLGLPLMT